jgi:hypothetical protein
MHMGVPWLPRSGGLHVRLGARDRGPDESGCMHVNTLPSLQNNTLSGPDLRPPPALEPNILL